MSSGCQNCYAERMARRQQAMGSRGYEGVVDADGWTGRVNFVPEVLNQLAKWKKPKRIFINSMSDTFHENADSEDFYQIWNALVKNNHHTYYVLTKRPENLLGTTLVKLDYDHIWLGVTVESQNHVDRIATLREHWNGKIFVSAEPLLGSIDLMYPEDVWPYQSTKGSWGGLLERRSLIDIIDWLIVGGESGHGARPMHPGWARSLRDQALQAGTPFFFKQWGEWIPCWQTPADGPVWMGKVNTATFMHSKNIESGKRDPDPKNGMSDYSRVGKKAAGRMLDGREWNEIPQ